MFSEAFIDEIEKIAAGIGTKRERGKLVTQRAPTLKEAIRSPAEGVTPPSFSEALETIRGERAKSPRKGRIALTNLKDKSWGQEEKINNFTDIQHKKEMDRVLRRNKPATWKAGENVQSPVQTPIVAPSPSSPDWNNFMARHPKHHPLLKGQPKGHNPFGGVAGSLKSSFEQYRNLRSPTGDQG